MGDRSQHLGPGVRQKKRRDALKKPIKITSNTSMKIQFGAGSRVKSQSRMKTRLQNNAKREQPPSNPGTVTYSNLSYTLRSRQWEVPPPNPRAATPRRQIEGKSHRNSQSCNTVPLRKEDMHRVKRAGQQHGGSELGAYCEMAVAAKYRLSSARSI